MKIVFLTNYLNHHTLQLCKELNTITNGQFHFIATSRVSKERMNFGYEDINKMYDFVVRMYEKGSRQKALDLILDCDVFIYGAAPKSIVEKRLKTGKLTFKYTERVYKNPCSWYEIPVRAIKYYWEFNRYKNLYLLCASAYTSGDYAKTGTFIKRAFKWGYFPETKEYDVEALVTNKQPNTILWAARMIDWKHPELAIEIAKRLKKDGYDFKLSIAGSGVMLPELIKMIDKYDLKDNVKLLGSMSPHEVRTNMENSEVFLMTSDRQEGWGAVLNEAMNSGCAVVANSATGSAPYLINDGENGFLYNENNINNMYLKVKKLLDDEEKRKQIQKNAYITVFEEWNAKTAAKRLFELSENIIAGKKYIDLFKDGVCSLAKPIKDNWYKIKDGEL